MKDRDCRRIWPLVRLVALPSRSVVAGRVVAAELLLLRGSSRVFPSLMESLCRCNSSKAYIPPQSVLGIFKHVPTCISMPPGDNVIFKYTEQCDNMTAISV